MNRQLLNLVSKIAITLLGATMLCFTVATTAEILWGPLVAWWVSQSLLLRGFMGGIAVLSVVLVFLTIVDQFDNQRLAEDLRSILDLVRGRRTDLVIVGGGADGLIYKYAKLLKEYAPPKRNITWFTYIPEFSLGDE